MPAPIKLTKDDIKAIKRTIDEDFHHAKRERSDWEEKLPQWELLYQGVVEKKDFPWPDAANVFLTVIGDLVDEVQARTMSALFGGEKWAPVQPTEGYDEVRWPKVESFMQYALQGEMKARGDFNAIVHNTIKNGTCFALTTWKRKLRTTREIRYLENSVSIGRLSMPIRPPESYLLSRTFGDALISRRKPRGKDYWECKLSEGGREHYARVWIDRNPKDKRGEIEVEIEREEIVFDAPEIRVLPEPSVYTTDVGDPQEAPFVIIEREVPLDWYKRKRASGEYDLPTNDEWRKILESQTDSLKIPSELDKTTDKQVEDDVAGTDTMTQASRTRPNWLCFYRWDINGDGFEEEAVFEYDPTNDVLLSADYLDRVYAHGRRPITIWRFWDIPGRLYGIGLPEMLWSIQLMINTLLNQAIDNQTLRNKPWGLANASANLDEKEEDFIVPGKITPIVGDPRDKIWFPELGSIPDHLMPFVQFLIQFMDRRVGRFSIAEKSNQKGSANFPRTFGGTVTLLQDGLFRIEHYIQNIAMGGQGGTSGFNELFHQIWDLYAQYMPKEKEFRIMGSAKPTFDVITRDDLRQRPDFMFSLSMAHTNPGIRAHSTAILWDKVSGQLLQSGALNEWKELLKRLYQDFGQRNLEAITPNLPGMLPRAPMSQELENDILIQGIPLDVLPVDNDIEHIRDMDEYKQDLAGALPEPARWEEFDRHYEQHIQSMQQKATPAGAPGAGRPPGQLGNENQLPGQLRPPRAPNPEATT